MATSNQLASTSGPDQLPALLHQLVADIADPTIIYLLAAHYYERTNHPCTRHYPAMFSLQQGQVHHLEVGADFIAFNTKFVRYPQEGEVGHHSPWIDHFRATAPFAQLYRLCRKVLTPVEQAATQLDYDDDTVIYYDARAHSRYHTPQEMDQGHDVNILTKAQPAVAVLRAVEIGLADPENHYLISTTSFESPAGSIQMGMLHLQTLTTRDFALTTDGFTCSVLLNPSDQRQWSTVHVRFDHIWQVLRSDGPDMDMEEIADAGGLIYHASEVLNAYLQQPQST